MNPRIFMTALLLVVMSAGNAVAAKEAAGKADSKIDDYLDACAKITASVKKKACLKKQIGFADGELKLVFKDVVEMINTDKAMPKKSRKDWAKKITASQTHWTKYKDLECKGSTPYKFWKDKQAAIEGSECVLRMTVARLKELDEYLGEDEPEKK